MQESYSLEPTLPAHRVLGSQGKLIAKAAFGQMLPLEQRLMDEGLAIKNNRVVHFKQHRWNPYNDEIL